MQLINDRILLLRNWMQELVWPYPVNLHRYTIYKYPRHSITIDNYHRDYSKHTFHCHSSNLPTATCLSQIINTTQFLLNRLIPFKCSVGKAELK